MQGKILVMGYRGLRHEQFFELIKTADARLLLDVRRNPYSPNPDYQKTALSAAAKASGVKYFHAPQLGVPGVGKSSIKPGQPTTFAEQMESVEAKKALHKILGFLAKGESVVLMCSEPNYRDCHRYQLVETLRKLAPQLELEELTAKGEQRLF